MYYNLFCLMGRTGSGKSMYLDKLLNDYNLKKYYGLYNLVYGTTREKRDNENGDEYKFVSNDEFFEMKDKELLLEYRKYNMADQGERYYFTTYDMMGDALNHISAYSTHVLYKNIVVSCSPDQFLKYVRYFDNKMKNKKMWYGIRVYNTIPIIIDVNENIRLDRLKNRCTTKKEYEECIRRIKEEEKEFSNYENKYKKFNEIIINNCSENEEDIESNYKKIANVIKVYNTKDAYKYDFTYI